MPPYTLGILLKVGPGPIQETTSPGFDIFLKLGYNTSKKFKFYATMTKKYII